MPVRREDAGAPAGGQRERVAAGRGGAAIRGLRSSLLPSSRSLLLRCLVEREAGVGGVGWARESWADRQRSDLHCPVSSSSDSTASGKALTGDGKERDGRTAAQWKGFRFAQRLGGTKAALVDAPAATQVALWARSAPQFEQARASTGLNSSCDRSECRNARAIIGGSTATTIRRAYAAVWTNKTTVTAWSPEERG